jgi:MioC protein
MRTELPAIRILVGTMTGNAERIAEEIECTLDGRARIEALDMDRLTPAVFDTDAVFLICSSTYGQGDVPDNARDFYKLLGEQRPDLRHVRYGVIALGDMTYPQTFANGGKRFDAILTELGATRLGAVFCHDASTGTLPEEEAVAWAGEWLATVEESMLAQQL